MTKIRVGLVCVVGMMVPVTAWAGNSAQGPKTVAGTLQVRAASGKVEQSIAFATIEGQCVDTKVRSDARSFEAQLCHRDTTADGQVIHVSWSLSDGKRIQSHEAWAVVAAGGTLEVGAVKGQGEALIVTLTK